MTKSKWNTEAFEVLYTFTVGFVSVLVQQIIAQGIAFIEKIWLQELWFNKQNRNQNN